MESPTTQQTLYFDLWNTLIENKWTLPYVSNITRWFNGSMEQSLRLEHMWSLTYHKDQLQGKVRSYFKKQEGLRTNHLLSFHYISSIWSDTNCTETTMSKSSSIVLRVRCQGNVFVKPLRTAISSGILALIGIQRQIARSFHKLPIIFSK
jgi:hypothetical protein